MENDIALMAAGYLALRIALLAAAAFLVYRVLRNKPGPAPVRIRTQSNYAAERRRVSRSGR